MKGSSGAYKDVDIAIRGAPSDDRSHLLYVRARRRRRHGGGRRGVAPAHDPLERSRAPVSLRDEAAGRGSARPVRADRDRAGLGPSEHGARARPRAGGAAGAGPLGWPHGRAHDGVRPGGAERATRRLDPGATRARDAGPAAAAPARRGNAPGAGAGSRDGARAHPPDRAARAPRARRPDNASLGRDFLLRPAVDLLDGALVRAVRAAFESWPQAAGAWPFPTGA